MRQSVWFSSSSDISLEVLSPAVALLLHACCWTCFIRVFTVYATCLWVCWFDLSVCSLQNYFYNSYLPAITVLALCCSESLFNKFMLKSRLFVSVLTQSVLTVSQYPAPTNLIICILNHPVHQYGPSAWTVTMLVTPWELPTATSWCPTSWLSE